jgi:hypothetical protein
MGDHLEMSETLSVPLLEQFALETIVLGCSRAFWVALPEVGALETSVL